MKSNPKKFWFWGLIILETTQDAKRSNPRAISEVWENLVIVQAKDEGEAYLKLCKIGKSEQGNCGGTLTLRDKPATTCFAGLANFGLIHDDLGDGAEIVWRSFNCAQSKIAKLVKPKKRLLSQARRELTPLLRLRS